MQLTRKLSTLGKNSQFLDFLKLATTRLGPGKDDGLTEC